MTNPDRSTKASETCLAVLTVVLVLMAFVLVVLALVDAYRP